MLLANFLKKQVQMLWVPALSLSFPTLAEEKNSKILKLRQ